MFLYKTYLKIVGKERINVMKKYLLLLAVALAIASTARANSCCGQGGLDLGRSFMFTRPLNQHLSMQQSFTDYIINAKKGDVLGYFDLIAAYQESLCPFNNINQRGVYFLPNCKNALLVSGDANTNDLLTRDIRAEWLGLPDNFRGTLTINPQQTQFGLMINYNQSLSILDKTIPFLADSWVNIFLPMVFVENSLNLVQHDVINTAATIPQDIIQAFNQPSWNYAKIPACRSTWQLAELKLEFGKTYLAEDFFLLDYYGLLTIPTADSQNPAFLFDAVAGNNGHAGIGAGVNFQILLNRDPNPMAICWFLHVEDIFLIQSTQLRTFDLKNKPWSRYLLLTPKNGPLGFTVPGVNVLTCLAHVHPYNVIDISTGFRLQNSFMQAEFGFNIWGHGHERVELLCGCQGWAQDYGIAGNPAGVSTTTPLAAGSHNVTASASTISTQAANDVNSDGELVFVPITFHDINNESAGTAGAINYKVHTNIGFYNYGRKVDAFFVVGIFFDLPERPTALPLGGGWAKVGASF